MVKKRYKLVSSFLVVILLSGCWDAINIEDRGFIVGVAIDLAEEGKKDGNYQLTVTNQIVVPPGLGTPGQSGGGDVKAFMNASDTGESLYSIVQKLANHTSKIPFFEHIKIVIVSEEVAAVPGLFADVMDVFIRNRDTRRGIKVIVAKGKAKDILNIQPANEKLPSRYINKILENSLIKTGEIKPVRVGDIHEYLLAKNSFVLSEVAPGEQEISFVGGAVFKGNSSKQIGNLNLKEMLGYELLTGLRVRGPILVDYKGKLTTYNIRQANSKIKMDVKNPENINIDVRIELEGEVQETFGTVILLKKGVITGLEKKVTEKIKEIVNDTIEKAQKDLEADVFGFGDHLRKFHYDTWKKVKKDWDHGENFFSKSNINVTVKAKVRADGVVEKSKE